MGCISGKTLHQFKEAYHKQGGNIMLIDKIKEGFYRMNKRQMSRLTRCNCEEFLLNFYILIENEFEMKFNQQILNEEIFKNDFG